MFKINFPKMSLASLPRTSSITLLLKQQLNTLKSSPQKVIISNRTIILTIVVCVVFANLVYKPLPDDFPQPWKYRLICFGADFLHVIVSITV